MEISFNVKLSRIKETNYIINIDLDPERISESMPITKPKVELGAIHRPSADRLKILKHPDLKAEEEATEKVMDTLEL